ncbi:MAG: CIA30 family protein, partial [bacterium]|nr:CIA30 family protein [bacterium]
MKRKIILLAGILLLFSSMSLAVELNPKTIDDFERPNQSTVYRVETQDESTLSINSTPRAKVGVTAIQVEYNLKTSRAAGSSVLMRCEPELNDWTNYDQLWIWIKGDGSGNIFSIFFTDASDEVWEYQDRDVLLSQKWQLLKVDFSEFMLTSSGENNNREIEKIILKIMDSGSSGGPRIPQAALF